MKNSQFICGIIGHMEEQCVQFKGKNEDDLSKPYGRWFQNDVLSDNYRRPQGKRFGLDVLHEWSMIALLHVVDGESMNGVTVEGHGDMERRWWLRGRRAVKQRVFWGRYG